jgi:hypothetical protein
MKDNTSRNTMQEKITNHHKNVFAPRGAGLGQPSDPAASARPQSDMLTGMSVPVRLLEQTHAQIRAAILHRRPIAALYRGRRRLLCPHLLGWNRRRRLQVLCYQYGGDSETGLQRDAPSENWRCLAVENLSQVELLDGPWQTAANRSRPQTCVEDVELDVDDYPELPSPKSAKL